MKYFVVIFVLSLLLNSAGTANAEEILTTDWVGTLQTGDNGAPLHLHLEQSGDALTGTAFAPSEKIMDAPISGVGRESNHLSVSVKTGTAEYTFDGTISNDSMDGTMTAGERKVPFRMIRLASVDHSKYFGAYRFEDKHCVYIRNWDELGDDQLTYFDDDGSAGPLYPHSVVSFSTGPALMLPLPEQAKITFLFNRKNKVTGLKWQDTSGKARTAQRITDLLEEEIRFGQKEAPLAGSLVLPAGHGPYPAVVMVHGSGPVTRNFFGPIAYWFANHGVAVLSYDKRGIGSSGGDWLEADFNTLASDALSGVALLKNRKDIDASRIGLFGISQGGWVVPLAASRSSDVKFAILLSAPSVSPAEQDKTRNMQEMRLAGSTEEEINKAMAGYQQQIDGLMSEEGLQWVQGEIKKAKDAGNTKLLASGGPDNPRFLLWLRGVLRYDPLPALGKVKCPVLAVYGELDRGVPVSDNKDTLESVLKKGGNQDVTVVILPAADHALFECKTGSASEFPYLHRFVPGFFDTMLTWMSTHISSK